MRCHFKVIRQAAKASSASRCSFELPLLGYAVCSLQLPVFRAQKKKKTGKRKKGRLRSVCICMQVQLHSAVAPSLCFFFWPRKFPVDRRRMLAALLFANRFVCACQIQTFAYFARLPGTINRHQRR